MRYGNALRLGHDDPARSRARTAVAWRTVRQGLLLLLLGLPIPAALRAERVDVCGPIAGDTTWTAANVYVISGCTVTVDSGATLRIEPGTVVKLWNWDWKLRVRGTLLAEGTAGAPIVFTSLRDDAHGGDTNGDGNATTPARGDWGLIAFDAGAHGRIRHASIAYGGSFSGFGLRGMVESRGASDVQLEDVTVTASAAAGIYGENASLRVARTTVGDITGYGIELNGLDPEVPLEIVDSQFLTNTPGIPAAAVRLGSHPPRIALGGNRAGGTGWNGVVLQGDVVRDLELETTGGLPLIAESIISVAQGATLAIPPGTIFKFRNWDWRLRVGGALVAEGTAEAPIVFTSLRDDAWGGDTNGDGSATLPAPGDWGLIGFESGAYGRIAHAFIGYGGYFSGHGLRGMVESRGGGDVQLDDVTITSSGSDGVYVEEASLLLRGRVVGNAYGVRNGTPSKGVVDARRVWWGDASGPLHRTKNPAGSGNEVGDGVLFFPWAVDEEGTVPTQVRVLGPTSVSPGDTVDYAVSLYAGEDIDDAVLLVIPPAHALFVDSTAGGIFWPERQELFWRLGNLKAGSDAAVSFRARYVWGIADDVQEGVLALVGGSNVSDPRFDVAPYLAYQPAMASASVVMTFEEVQAELDSNLDMKGLYDAGRAEGLEVIGGTRGQSIDGTSVTRLIMGRPDGQVTLLLVHEGDSVYASRLALDDFSIVVPGAGVLTLDFKTQEARWTGSPQGLLRAPFSAALPGFWPCVIFCLTEKGIVWTVTLYYPPVRLLVFSQQAYACWDALSKCQQGSQEECLRALIACQNGLVTALREFFDVTGLREFGGLSACVNDCRRNPNSHGPAEYTDCLKGLGEPPYMPQTFYPRRFAVGNATDLFAGSDLVVTGSLPPDLGTAAWEVSPCATDARCRPGVGCVACPSGSRDCASATTRVRVAKDPNAKSGPLGDLVPGQQVEYVVEYENLGQGRAYGVYVIDQLSPDLDATTLDLGGKGAFQAATRTITWEVGDLEPKGQPGSKGAVSFKVRLNTGVPSATPITNQAVVYFPSVPEETATNATVNVVEPLAAVPQRLETPYRQPIAVTLGGRDASNAPLSFAITQPPLNGELTGTAPTLTYTPAENFTGYDRLAFTVSNGISTSRPADVALVVKPSAAETTPPTVVWTSPQRDEAVRGVSSRPLYSDAGGPLFSPFVQVGFSEVLDPTTVSGSTVGVVNAGGQPVTVSVGYDGVGQRIVLVPRQPWPDGTYTATVATGVKDASGNGLVVPYTWAFTIAGLSAPCPGDCDGDREVTIDELVTLVNIALGTRPAADCTAGDGDGDGQVTIDEIIVGVNVALGGCGG